MGILVNTGFDVGSSNPIDNRTVKNTTNERDELVSEGKVYENLKVYCKDTKKEYRWTGTEWETVDSSGSGVDLDLTDYQKKTDNTLDTTDKTVTGAINEVNGNLLDTVGFSADYKNIILNRKNGLNPYTIPISAIINNASLAELKDIDSTDVGNGKTLIYDDATGKHKYVGITGTDELVKMDSTGDAHYLADLLDKQTVINDNGILKVKKLDGQEVTIAEINYLKGLTMNVMDLVSAFANGGVKVLNTPLNTASELDTMDRTSFIEGISYIVYVLADETHTGAKTTYLCTKTSTTFFGNADSQRNFTTNPIDLANEVTGKLGTSNIDVDSLWTLLTINDTYKTLTTNNEIFGTHGAKAMYDELTTSIGEKANATDLTTHTGNTDIHITSGERTKWNNKANASDIPTKVSELTNDSNYVTEETVNTKLETKTASSVLRFGYWNSGVTDTYLQIPAPITVNDQSLFVTITSYQGGCIILLSGDSKSDYKLTKCVRLSHDNILSHDATDVGPEKLLNVYVDKSNGCTYVKLGANGSVSIIGINKPPVSVTTLPTDGIEEVPIVDLTQEAYQGVKDMPKTTLTPVFPDEVKVASGGVAINYIVRNGWCSVNFAFNVVAAPIFSWTDIATGLPKPANSANIVLMNEKGKINRTIPIKINSNGSVSLSVPTEINVDDWWTGNISYPVAES